MFLSWNFLGSLFKFHSFKGLISVFHTCLNFLALFLPFSFVFFLICLSWSSLLVCSVPIAASLPAPDPIATRYIVRLLRYTEDPADAPYVVLYESQPLDFSALPHQVPDPVPSGSQYITSIEAVIGDMGRRSVSFSSHPANPIRKLSRES